MSKVGLLLRNTVSTIAFIFGAIFCISLALEAKAERLPYEAVPGEIIVGLKSEKRANSSSRWAAGGTMNLLSLLGEDAKVVRNLSTIDGIVISAPALRTDEEIDQALTKLNADASIFSAERNYLYYADQKPADPYVSKMWFLNTISAYQAWRKRSGSPGIVVAVIDTGVQLNHDDLKDRIWINPREIPNNGIDDDRNGYIDDVKGWNFFGGNNNPDAEYVAKATRGCKPHPTKRLYENHGTHVAGTIGASANNNVGGTGITHDVRIMALKVLGGPCGAGRTDAIFEAIAYATANGAQVINLSLGSRRASSLMRREIEAAIRAGVSVVAAAGNSAVSNDVTPHFPAAYPVDGLVSVAATDSNDVLAKFSNYGQRTVDLAAPGVNILNTVPAGTAPNGAKSGYKALNGTSMAAPIVAGSVALMRAEYPKLSPADIEARLLRAVDPVAGLKSSVRAGGRLNLAKLLGESRKPVTPPKQGTTTKVRTPSAPRVIDGIRLGDGPTERKNRRNSAPAKSGEISGKSLY